MLQKIFSCFSARPKPEPITITECKSDFSTYNPYRYSKTGFARDRSSNINIRFSQKAKVKKLRKVKTEDHVLRNSIIDKNQRRRKLERQRRSEIFREKSQKLKKPIFPQNSAQPKKCLSTSILTTNSTRNSKQNQSFVLREDPLTPIYFGKRKSP